MPLTDQEKDAFRAQVLEELSRKESEQEVPSLEPMSVDAEREELIRQAEMVRIRQDVEHAFYRERGYVQYTDSRGIISYLPADEVARRKRRHHKRKRRFPRKQGRSWLFVVGVLVLAVLVGLMIS